ncbi:SCP-like protein [Ancylostoma duodenale]|uniref:SCP-like protein n=1 Tax=Ancylostoma duodenale TaxID=51022 RepID=A0A0C2FJ36_9BILA|nr:SCP-like protein [Ancylostoma duodenale]
MLSCTTATTILLFHRISQKFQRPEETNPRPLCPAGSDDGLTYEAQITVQNMINYYRRLVGTGWAPDKNGYAPVSSLMPGLTYNCEVLGNLSKAIADKCERPPYTPSHGRTLSYHIIEKINLNPKTVLQEAIKTWAEQSKKIDIRKIGGVVFYDNGFEVEAPDFAKMMFSQSLFAGCSVKECKDKGFTLAICQYNQLFTYGDPIYDAGKSCSRCAAWNRKCDTALGGGLCIK